MLPETAQRRRQTLEVRPWLVESANLPMDAVGYGRPPKATQFKKGQSGNPRASQRNSVGRRGAAGDPWVNVSQSPKTAELAELPALEVMLRRLANDAMRNDRRGSQDRLDAGRPLRRSARKPDQARRDAGRGSSAILANFLNRSSIQITSEKVHQKRCNKMSADARLLQALLRNDFQRIC